MSLGLISLTNAGVTIESFESVIRTPVRLVLLYNFLTLFFTLGNGFYNAILKNNEK